MPHEHLILQSGDASTSLRQAASEEVIIRRFGGVGPLHPHITRIIVEYDDPRSHPEPVDPVND